MCPRQSHDPSSEQKKIGSWTSKPQHVENDRAVANETVRNKMANGKRRKEWDSHHKPRWEIKENLLDLGECTRFGSGDIVWKLANGNNNGNEDALFPNATNVLASNGGHNKHCLLCAHTLYAYLLRFPNVREPAKLFTCPARSTNCINQCSTFRASKGVNTVNREISTKFMVY